MSGIIVLPSTTINLTRLIIKTRINFLSLNSTRKPHLHTTLPNLHKTTRKMAAVRQRAVATLPTLMRAMRKEAPNRIRTTLPSLRRAFSLYDQINLIDNVPDDQLRFQQFSDTGFKVNGVFYEGSLLCVGNLLMSWSPRKFSEVTPESLSIFQTLRPVPEILVLGCGRNIQPVSPELRRFIRSIGMKLEAVDSRNASSTYNILNEEGRIVAAAMIPFGAES